MLNHLMILLALISIATPIHPAGAAEDGAFDYLYDHILLGDDAPDADTQKAELPGAEPETQSEPTPVDSETLVRLESLGTIFQATQGAMEKSIWKDQNRSDIYNQIATLPARHGMLSMQNLKKNLLLSQTDASLIKNNVTPEAGKDLLDLRLQKLMEMGLIDEALTLYRSAGEEPYHENLARTGMLLMIYHGDFATACLEEKVIASRYPDSRFWKLLDQSCQIDLGLLDAAKADFKDSPNLQKIYANPAFVVSALDQTTLSSLTALERGILAAQNRIDFSGLAANPAAIKNLRSDLLALYLHQKNKPEALTLPLQNESFARGLIPITSMRKFDPDYKRIFELETPEEQWTELAKKLAGNLSPESLRHYGSMISLAKPASISDTDMYKAISVIVSLGETVAPFWADELEKRGDQNPENYVYLQLLDQIGLLENTPVITPEQLKKGLMALSHDRAIQAISLTESLDSLRQSDHNPLKVYEKDIDLTVKGSYVMPTVSLMEMVGAAADKQQTGLVVLLSLQLLQDRVERIHPDTLEKVLSGLNRVGLIEESRKISQEWLAALLTQATKGE